MPAGLLPRALLHELSLIDAAALLSQTVYLYPWPLALLPL
jgi:hypothetical protein